MPALVLSHLDYYNTAVLFLHIFLPQHWWVWEVLHVAGRVVLNLKPSDSSYQAQQGSTTRCPLVHVTTCWRHDGLMMHAVKTTVTMCQ